MTDYTHLSMRERCLIATFLSMKTKVSIIAERMGRHRSTFYREIKRNKQNTRYRPGLAHELAKQRHPHPNNKLKPHQSLNKYVIKGLQKGWSPEQISGRLRYEKKEVSVCNAKLNVKSTFATRVRRGNAAATKTCMDDYDVFFQRTLK